jgi:hypothetical protein
LTGVKSSASALRGVRRVRSGDPPSGAVLNPLRLSAARSAFFSFAAAQGGASARIASCFSRFMLYSPWKAEIQREPNP